MGRLRWSRVSNRGLSVCALTVSASAPPLDRCATLYIYSSSIGSTSRTIHSYSSTRIAIDSPMSSWCVLSPSRRINTHAALPSDPDARRHHPYQPPHSDLCARPRDDLGCSAVHPVGLLWSRHDRLACNQGPQRPSGCVRHEELRGSKCLPQISEEAYDDSERAHHPP